MFVSRQLKAFLFIAAFVGVAMLVSQASDPWATAKLLQPAELAKELSDPGGSKPTIVYVGPQFLYRGGHIPGAVFHGAAGNPAGLQDLKAWAQNLPRTQSIVIYCGCCPFENCPNVRPAFNTLQEMGFKQLRVLKIPTNFETDWVRKWYPVEK
jgi:hypothetical protein